MNEMSVKAGGRLGLVAGGGGLPSPDTDALLKQLKALQEQVALLDRIQNIRWVVGGEWGGTVVRPCL